MKSRDTRRLEGGGGLPREAVWENAREWLRKSPKSGRRRVKHDKEWERNGGKRLSERAEGGRNYEGRPKKE